MEEEEIGRLVLLILVVGVIVGVAGLVVGVTVSSSGVVVMGDRVGPTAEVDDAVVVGDV